MSTTTIKDTLSIFNEYSSTSCNFIQEKINFTFTIIKETLTERIQIVRLFELSSLEFEKHDTLEAIKKGNFLTFLLFISVLGLLIIIDKRYGFQSRRNKKKLIKSNSSSSISGVNSSGGIGSGTRSRFKKGSVGRKLTNSSTSSNSTTSSPSTITIPDIEHLQNKRSQRDNLHVQHKLENEHYNKNKLRLSQSAISLSTLSDSDSAFNISSSNNTPPFVSTKVSTTPIPTTPILNSISSSSNNNNEKKQILLRGSDNDGDGGDGGGNINITSSMNSNITSEEGYEDDIEEEEEEEHSSEENNHNLQHGGSPQDEARRLLNRGIRERAREKQRATILNSQLLEEVQKNKKANLPPQFKRIRSSKKNSYSYQSSSLFNSSTITHSKLNGGCQLPQSPLVVNNNNTIISPPPPSTNSPLVFNHFQPQQQQQQPQSSQQFNSNNLLPFFNAKIDTTNYIPTQTFGYNYKCFDQPSPSSSSSQTPPSLSPLNQFLKQNSNNSNNNTPITTNNVNSNNSNSNSNIKSAPSSPNHNLVELVEYHVASPVLNNNGNSNSILNSNKSNSSQMLLSIDQFLEKKSKEQEIINNTIVVNSNNSNNNNLIPTTIPIVIPQPQPQPQVVNSILEFKNIRISDHAEKKQQHSPINRKSRSPKNRNKLLMSNYHEGGFNQSSTSSSVKPSSDIEGGSGSENNGNGTIKNISLRFASSGITTPKIEKDLNDDYGDDEKDEDEDEDYDDDDNDDDEKSEFTSDPEEESSSHHDDNEHYNQDEEHEKIEQLYKEKSSSTEHLNKLVEQQPQPTSVTTTTTTTTVTTNINNNLDNSNNPIAQIEEDEDYCDSDIDGEDFSSVNIDYNERFQEIMEDLRNIDCNSLQSDKIRVNSQFIALTQDFVYASSTFGKVIISERYLPNSEKTIPSIDIGGLAGGDKFIVHGILFKFAIDREDFYGSDYASMCVGGHELKGLINVFNCNVSHLSLPLMALVDYRGFRVIAMSILPVDKDSIYYGSNDYGLSIHNNDEFLSGKVQEVSTLLNIKSHRCGEQGTFVHSPADLEGHRGFDGRYYLLDFARLYPPEAPRKDIKMGHLYRLLRPEFVRNYKKPLCSDSFSRFIRGHNEQEHNAETLEATSYLLNTTIPELVEELNSVELDRSNVYTFPITETLHRSGVNVRYLGYIRQSCQSLDMKSLIFIEMCARVVKQQLRQKLRFKMKQAKIPLEAPYRRLIVTYLNRILGISDKSDLFWNEHMKKYLMKKFDKGLFEDEMRGNSLILGLSSFSDHLIDGKYLLFKRIQKMTGLKFTHRINEEFRLQPNCWLFRGENPLDINDLDEIGIRVKYVPFMNVAQGYLFKVKGEMLFNSGDPIAANRFFKMALEKLEAALETDPNNTNTLCTVGEVYFNLGIGDLQGVSEVQFSDRHNPDIDKAFQYFQRAIFSNPNHTESLFRYAQLLERCGEYDSAEDYYISSLLTNPNNIVCLQEYGNFLQSARNDFVTAEQFFMRGSINHQYLQKLKQPNPINIRSSSGLLKVKSSASSSSSSNLIPNNYPHNSNNNINNNHNNNNSSSNSSGSGSGNVNTYDYSSSNSSTTSSNISTSTIGNNSNNSGSSIFNNNSNNNNNNNGTSSSSPTSSPSGNGFRNSGNNIFNNNELRGSGGCIRLTPPFLGLSSQSNFDLSMIRENNIRKSNGSIPNSPRSTTTNRSRSNSINSANNGSSNNNSDCESPLQRKLFMIN